MLYTDTRSPMTIILNMTLEKPWRACNNVMVSISQDETDHVKDTEACFRDTDKKISLVETKQQQFRFRYLPSSRGAIALQS